MGVTDDVKKARGIIAGIVLDLERLLEHANHGTQIRRDAVKRAKEDAQKAYRLLRGYE